MGKANASTAEVRLSGAKAIPAGTALVDDLKGKRAKYKHVYTTGPFCLPQNTHSIDWGVLNNDSTPQKICVTVFKCSLASTKVAEPPGPLEVTLNPGETTHNANAAAGGFYYEIQVETNSQLVFPYASAWPAEIGDPIPAAVVKSAEFIRKLS